MERNQSAVYVKFNYLKHSLVIIGNHQAFKFYTVEKAIILQTVYVANNQPIVRFGIDNCHP